MNPGKLMIGAGVLMVIFGIILLSAGRVIEPGRLPGDIFIQKKNLTFYFPLGLCVVLSLFLTFVLRLFGKH